MQTANQITFITMVIDHLTEHGQIAPELLYESPFTDVTATGPNGIFSDTQVERMLAILGDIRRNAAA